MQKKKLKNKKRNVHDFSSDPSKTEGQYYQMSIPFIKNVILFFVLFVIGFQLIDNVNGYVWMRDKFLQSNLDKIEKFKDADTDKKYEAYFGFDYRFLSYIRDNTADSAMILMPPDSAIFPVNGKSDFNSKRKNQSIRNHMWSMYFIYPRMLVYVEKYLDSPDSFDYTHVACVNGWGYEYLDYSLAPNQSSKYQIWPRTKEGYRELIDKQKQQ